MKNTRCAATGTRGHRGGYAIVINTPDPPHYSMGLALSRGRLDAVQFKNDMPLNNKTTNFLVHIAL